MKLFIFCSVIMLGFFFGCKSNEENKETNAGGDERSIKTDDQSFLEVNKEEGIKWSGEGDHKYDPSQTLYFSHAFIYTYTNAEESGEFWIYHNPENGQLLYMPEDPMVDFVVSDTLGNYYFFGDDGHGVKTVDSQFVDWVADSKLYDKNASYPISDKYVSIKPTGKKKSLDELSNMEGKPLVGKEYQWTFNQVSGNQSTYITEMIPINFYQVYGFNKLEGDIALPVRELDFAGIFGKNQIITYLESEDLKLELSFYQFNFSFVEAGDYEYSVQISNSSWKKERLPLLSEK